MQIFTLVTGVIYIVLEIRQKTFMWVIGVLTSLAAMWVFFRQGLRKAVKLRRAEDDAFSHIVTSFDSVALFYHILSKRKRGQKKKADAYSINVMKLKPLSVRASAHTGVGIPQLGGDCHTSLRAGSQ